MEKSQTQQLDLQTFYLFALLGLLLLQLPLVVQLISKVSLGVYDVFCAGLLETSLVLVTLNEWQGGIYYAPRAEFRSNSNYRIYFQFEAGFSIVAYNP